MQLVRLHHEMAAKMIALLEHSQGQRYTHYALLTTHYSLPTAYYLLPPTYCLLLATTPPSSWCEQAGSDSLLTAHY